MEPLRRCYRQLDIFDLVGFDEFPKCLEFGNIARLCVFDLACA